MSKLIHFWFGNGNTFRLTIDNTYLAGELPYIATHFLSTPLDSVQYMIICGHILGSSELKYETPLHQIITADDYLTVHIIFHNPKNMSITDTYHRKALYVTGNSKLVQTTHNQNDVLIVLTAEEYLLCTEEVPSVTTLCYCGMDLPGVPVRRIKTCRHMCHNQCLEQWLTTISVKCPYCEADVRSSLNV